VIPDGLGVLAYHLVEVVARLADAVQDVVDVTDEALDLGDSTAGQRAGRHHALERLGMIFSAGLTSKPRLFLNAVRPEKTLCDEAGITQKQIAIDLFARAIDVGLVSAAWTAGFPKQMWVVDDGEQVLS
jgi:hypothetical protein